MTWFKDHFHQHQYHHHLNITNAVYFIYMYMYVLCDLKMLISQCEMTVMIKIFYIKDLLSSSLEHWVVKIPDLFYIFHYFSLDKSKWWLCRHVTDQAYVVMFYISHWFLFLINRSYGNNLIVCRRVVIRIQTYNSVYVNKAPLKKIM